MAWESPVNIALIKNPLNWAIVVLMLIFAMLIAEAIIQLVKGPCSCHSTSTKD